jgi:predicted permease
MKQAQAVLDVLAQRYEDEHRRSGYGYASLPLRPVREVFASADVQKAIPGFVGVMIFVLLIACANVANLNLARAEARQHELAIRSALGAGRFQLLRQLLLESLLPALAGAVLGLVLTYWSLGLLEWLLPPEVLRMRAIELDWQVLAYSLLVAVTASLVSGTVPAWYGATRPVANALKQSGVQATSGGFRNLYRRGLVVLEVSLAMVLLAGAGLMIQSVFRLLRTNLINMEIQPRYDSETYRTTEANNFLLEEVHRRLSALPGVEAVGIVQKGYGQGKYAVTRQGNPVELNWNVSEVGTADAFKALRVRLLGGRLFEQADLGLGTNATAILVNQSLARRCWPGENAVGKILHSTNAYEPSTLEVVGVVADTRRMGYGFLIQPIVPMFYRPRQAVVDLGGYAGYDVLVRTRTKPEGLIQPLLAELKAAGPGLRKPTVALVKNDFYASTRAHRTYMWQLAAFGAVGLLLAAVGVYAILAHSVALREREMGIRMALGAGRPGVLRMVLRQGMTLVGIGIILGLGAAIALTRLLRSMLYGVSPLDPLTLAAGALLISLIALLACYVPARRAAKVDPMVALRCE